MFQNRFNKTIAYVVSLGVVLSILVILAGQLLSASPEVGGTPGTVVLGLYLLIICLGLGLWVIAYGATWAIRRVGYLIRNRRSIKIKVSTTKGISDAAVLPTKGYLHSRWLKEEQIITKLTEAQRDAIYPYMDELYSFNDTYGRSYGYRNETGRPSAFFNLWQALDLWYPDLKIGEGDEDINSLEERPRVNALQLWNAGRTVVIITTVRTPNPDYGKLSEGTSEGMSIHWKQSPTVRG